MLLLPCILVLQTGTYYALTSANIIPDAAAKTIIPDAAAKTIIPDAAAKTIIPDAAAKSSEKINVIDLPVFYRGVKSNKMVICT